MDKLYILPASLVLFYGVTSNPVLGNEGGILEVEIYKKRNLSFEIVETVTNSKNQEKKAKSFSENLKEKEGALKRVKKEAADAFKAYDKVSNLIAVQKDGISSFESEITAINSKISNKNKEIITCAEQLEKNISNEKSKVDCKVSDIVNEIKKLNTSIGETENSKLALEAAMKMSQAELVITKTALDAKNKAVIAAEVYLVDAKKDDIAKKVEDICGKNSQLGSDSIISHETCKKKVAESMLLSKLGWGIGLSLTANFSGDKQVSEAIMDSQGFVRVTDHKNSQIRPMVEVNAMIWCLGDTDTVSSDDADIECGPFFAAELSKDNVFTSFGGGFMWSFKKNGAPIFNVGIGIMVDPGVKMLLEGIDANQALPSNFPALGENNMLPESAYRKGTQVASFIMITMPLNSLF
jgi:hypothetical protein